MLAVCCESRTSWIEFEGPCQAMPGHTSEDVVQ